MRPALPPATGRRLRRAAGRLLPLGLLALELVLSFQYLHHTEQLKPHVLADTHSYRRAAEARTLEQAFSQHRTFGYPLLLRYIERSQASTSQLPGLQAQIALAAVALFFLGVRSYSGSGWLALAAATPLVWARSFAFVAWVYSDSLAISLSVAAAGAMLLLARHPRNPWAWAGVTLAVLATYHTRPSTIFLIVVAPLLLVALRSCRSGESPRRLWRWGLGLAAATLLPFLVYATLRWTVVGHFGLTSFGGANLIGLTACLIDADLVEELPPEQARLAHRIRVRREELGWRPMIGSSDPAPCFEQYNDNVWKIAVPVSSELARKAQRSRRRQVQPAPPARRPAMWRRAHWIEQNRMMTELSREIIRRRPYLYLDWVREAWGYGLRQLADDAWLVWPLLALVLTLPFAWLYGAAGGRAGPAASETDPRRKGVLLGLFVLATGYFAVHMLLVCMVSYPIPRYAVASSVFLPALLCALLFELWRRILGRLRDLEPDTRGAA